MEFSLAYIKNDKQFVLRQFDQEQAQKGQILELDELTQVNTQGIFVNKETFQNDEVFSKIVEQNKSIPIKTLPDYINSSDDFEGLTKSKAEEFFFKTNSNWVISNNLYLLENLFEFVGHLKPLFVNDRTAFFEELWGILKKNLGASELRLIYNHIKKGTKEGEKNKLIRVIIEGDRKPQPIENKELGSQLLKNFEGRFEDHMTVAEYDEETGEIVLLAQINSSPFIIMAKVFQWTPLQRSLIKTLIDGIN